jgi:hypothetical protein
MLLYRYNDNYMSVYFITNFAVFEKLPVNSLLLSSGWLPPINTSNSPGSRILLPSLSIIDISFADKIKVTSLTCFGLKRIFLNPRNDHFGMSTEASTSLFVRFYYLLFSNKYWDRFFNIFINSCCNAC